VFGTVRECPGFTQLCGSAEFYQPPVSFQGGSEVMDLKVEDVTDFKEEEEDSSSVTCPELKIEKEVSCLCMCVNVYVCATVT
jgi:hypothetical protein